MNKLLNIGWKILILGGGWVPLLVFTTHFVLSRVLHVYDLWPHTDIPFHFIGGFAIAFFVSRCFQLLPRESVKKSRVVVLELLLIGSFTASVAVCWVFAEFTFDQIFGSNIQTSLANTMVDLAMGVLGAILPILIRSWQLHVGKNEVREITYDWVRGFGA